ncbi:MAG: polysaccharide deacetylase family protein [Candidatus Saccharimonadaceae bacterium]|nr:polysaccharide deacetylase family protein [Candidatus Saccharimonadaceae bacterium]
MKVATHHRNIIIYVIVSVLIVAGLVILSFFTLTNKPSTKTKDTNNDIDSTIIDDIEPEPDDNTQPDDNQQADTSVCIGNEINTSKFTLTSSAKVYTTALEAKNKTNPASVYPPGEYFIYKCYDGIANISRTPDSPGGWIDPKNPYDESTTPDNTPNDSSEIDVMTIDNTIVNWSHEYPTAFAGEYNGFWNISPNKLYLTFDCGYDYNNLASTIMDTLDSKGIKAVFFVTGDFMNDRPDLIQRMVNEGHIVGNHSYAHLNQPQNLNISSDIVINDIRAWEEKYQNIMGSNPSTLYFRPPGGAISRRSMALMDQLGYKTLMWGTAYKDWDTSTQPTPDSVMTLLRQYTTPGDIILLHGISQTSSDILGQYIDEYRGKGFEFSLP